MSATDDIRGKLKADLEAITGMGKVTDRPPFVTDWAAYLSRFTITHPSDAAKKLVCLAWLSRRSFQEIEMGKGSRDEAEAIVAVQRDETWEVVLLVGYQDDEAAPSQFTFDTLVDRIADKWRLMDAIGMPEEVEESWPLQLEAAGFYTFGEVLCHKATMSIRIQRRITS